tara:strand:- start:147 stop:671 length:525 start_codon:yes stop_codon:yes gene_type:complete
MADRKEFKGQVDFTGGFHANERYIEPVFTAATTHTDGGTFVKNTLNFINVTATKTFNLPAAATSKKGDVVIVKYVADIANSAEHVYDTDAASFAATSNIVVAKELAAGSGFAAVTAPNGSSQDELTLSGATNGGCGVGSQLYFVYTGSQWAVHHGEIYHRSAGNGSAAITVAFA